MRSVRPPGGPQTPGTSWLLVSHQGPTRQGQVPGTQGALLAQPFRQTPSWQHVRGHLLTTPCGSSLAGWQPPEPKTGYSVREPSRQPPPPCSSSQRTSFSRHRPQPALHDLQGVGGSGRPLRFSPAPQVQGFSTGQGELQMPAAVVTLLGLLGLLTSSMVKPRGRGRSPWKSGAQLHLCH